MTPLDKIMPFMMQNWLLLLLACVLTIVICFVWRRSRWIIALWLPSFALAVACTLFFLSVFFTPHGYQSPNDGFLGMALMFQALFSLPVFLTVVLLLFTRPPNAAWRSPFLLVGIAAAGVTPLLLRITFYATQLPVAFAVTDSNGIPLRGIEFRLLGDRSPVASTDDIGRLVRRMDHGKDLQGAFVADGYLPHSVAINVAGKRLHVSHNFPKPGSSHEHVYTDEFYPLSNTVQVPVIMTPTPTP